MSQPSKADFGLSFGKGVGGLIFVYVVKDDWIIELSKCSIISPLILNQNILVDKLYNTMRIIIKNLHCLFILH